MLLGGASYEPSSKVWPDLTELADGKDSVHPGYDSMPKYVVSTTLSSAAIKTGKGAKAPWTSLLTYRQRASQVFSGEQFGDSQIDWPPGPGHRRRARFPV
jgi:hypothetical protein